MPEGLTITIPVYNRPELIGRCLTSLLPLRARPLNIIVVDDGSDDETANVAEEFVDQFLLRDIALIVNRAARQGAPQARNRGAALARTPLVMFLDSDDYADPEGLDQFLEQIDSKPFDLAVGQVERIGIDGASRGVVGTAWSPDEISRILDYHWTTNSVIYRKRFLDKIGGWRPELRGSQDWELQVRAKLACRDILFAPIRIAYWIDHSGPRVGTSGFRRSYAESVLIACGMILMLLEQHGKATRGNIARVLGRAMIHVRELRGQGVPRRDISRLLSDHWPRSSVYTTIVRLSAYGMGRRRRQRTKDA